VRSHPVTRAKNKEVTMRVAWIIRQHRQTTGINQGVVSEAIGVTQSTYQRMETGQNVISVPHLLHICQVLKLDPVELLRAVQG